MLLIHIDMKKLKTTQICWYLDSMSHYFYVCKILDSQALEQVLLYVFI